MGAQNELMKKFRLAFLISLALALAGVVSSVRWSEPWYHLCPISYWLAKYGDGPGNYKPSTEADRALRQMGSNAVPYLLKLLHSTNSHSYYALVGKNNQRGMFPVVTPPASRVGGHLNAWSINLRSRFQRVTVPASWDHWKAYLAFQALGPKGKPAIPDLIKLANDSSNNSSPSNTGEVPRISFWSDKENVAMFVAQSSTYLPHGAPVVSPKISIVGGGFVPQPFLPDGEIAAWSLAAIGADSVPPLMEMLTNSDPRIRCRAAIALGMIGKAADPAVPALVKALDDRGGSNSSEWNPAPYSYSRTPGNVLYDPVLNVRRAAVDALGCIGERPHLVVPALMKFLENRNMGFYPIETPEAHMEVYAIQCLGAFGERATNAIPALLTVFQTQYTSLDQTIGQYMIGDVALALNKISPEVTRKEIAPLLIVRIRNSRSPWIQSMTLSTLGQMTNQPDLVLPVLLEALDNVDRSTRFDAIYSLGRFGSAAKPTIPKLISFSTCQDTNLCRIATNALDKIEPGWRTSH